LVYKIQYKIRISSLRCLM